jgi:hypothetical protein
LGFADKYLKKHQFITLDIPGVSPKTRLLKYIVVIPAFCEPEIFNTLESVRNTHGVEEYIEVFILVNYGEHVSQEIKQQNQQLFLRLLKWSKQNNTEKIFFHPLITENLPRKHAGAGLARKILMDAACKRFSQVNNPNGTIFSLDADSLVPANYFTSVTASSKTHLFDCYIFNFAHPVSGNKFTPGVYNAVAQYELHLRYYKQILEQVNYPYSFYTIGSCFAIKAATYVKMGGMSRRKAGEDFYFLHKVFPVSDTLFLKDSIVTPSPRPSWRVPFGTGPAIRTILSGYQQQYATYHPESFNEIAVFLSMIPEFYTTDQDKFETKIYSLPDKVRDFLLSADAVTKIKEIKKNSASKETFIKRFYAWFDAFNILKLLNFLKNNKYGEIGVKDAVQKFLGTQESDLHELLRMLRKRDLE